MKTLDIEIHEKEPQGFAPKVQVALCCLEIDQKLLLLQNSPGKLESGKWGVPAGKLEENESPRGAAIRELFEETGISIQNPSQMEHVSTLYIRKFEVDCVYHQFKIRLDEVPAVHLSDEHTTYHWATSQDLEELPLMAGASQVLQHIRALIQKKRVNASVNVYLLLKQDNKALFLLRKNTGYCDGMWCLTAGHVEDGESATEGMIREAKEEIGIELTPAQIKVCHIMHRKTNRINVDVFLECSSWQGSIQNCEPDKCEQLAFFSLDDLPANTVEFNVAALQAISRGEFYSEFGWEP